MIIRSSDDPFNPSYIYTISSKIDYIFRHFIYEKKKTTFPHENHKLRANFFFFRVLFFEGVKMSLNILKPFIFFRLFSRCCCY